MRSIKHYEKCAILILNLLVFSACTLAQGGSLTAGNELGLAWRERQKTYSMVGQRGRSGLLNSTSKGTGAGPVSLDPQPDTEHDEVALEFKPGKTEAPVIMPSVSRIVGETQYSPAMAKSYVDSLNAEYTAAGATISAIEPMLAQNANNANAIGLSMASAQMNAEAALDAQLTANGQNGENVRNIFRGCLAKRLQDHDNYLQAVEFCRGGSAKPQVMDEFVNFGGNAQRMKPADSPDHSLQYGGTGRPTELLLSEIIFSQNVHTAQMGYSRSSEHLHTGFRALFGDYVYDYNKSTLYNKFGVATQGTVVSPVLDTVEPLLLPYSANLKLPNGSRLRNSDYYIALQGMSKLMRGLPLYDRYRAEYTYATLVGVTRGYCEYFRNHIGDNGITKTDHNDNEDRFWRLLASGKAWSAGGFNWPGTWIPADENAMGVLSVGDFAFTDELGQWLVSAFFRERRIDPSDVGGGGSANPCVELNPYNDDTRYMEIKRRLRAKESDGTTPPVPVYLRRYVEYADDISRMQTLMILNDTWNDVLGTLGDSQYRKDAAKLINLAAGSLDVTNISADITELQQSLASLLERLQQDYQNNTGTGSGIRPAEKGKGQNEYGN